MLVNFLKIFVVTAGTFFLFFYSAPYWTGSSMEGLIDNGVYRAFYVLCSTAGHLAYQLIEFLSERISSLLGRKSDWLSNLIYTLLSLGLLTGALLGLQQVYEYLFSDMLAVGEITVSNEHDYLSRFSDLFVFFKLTAGYLDGTFSGFFRAIGKALSVCMAYFWGTVIYFSFLFGLLSPAVVTIDGDSFNADSFQSDEKASLPEQCLDHIKEAAGKLCYLRHFETSGCRPVVLLVAAVYSLNKLRMGGEADGWEFVMKIIESTDVIDLVINCIIEQIWLIVLYYCICLPVYHVLPTGLQTTLKEFSDACGSWAQGVKGRRSSGVKYMNLH